MGLALLKVGGSVVTFKDKPLSVNKVAINKISKVLSKVKRPLIVVHGGGSFGHYYSVKYDIHTKPARYDPRAVSLVKSSMIQLNDHIVSIMVKNKLNPYTVPPSALIRRAKGVKNNIRELKQLALSGLIPVTYGDVLHYSNSSYYILSGDALMGIIAKELKPDVALFALSVDGVYRDLQGEELVREIIAGKQIKFSQVPADVTGGMCRKMREAFKISRTGIDVLMVNGLKPERILNALRNKKFEGTIVKGVRK
ncbi:MAG: isopentenyl phosphate kinase [Nitrososphaerales archaeon]